MSGLMWLLLGAALCAALGFLVLQRRARDGGGRIGRRPRRPRSSRGWVLRRRPSRGRRPPGLCSRSGVLPLSCARWSRRAVPPVVGEPLADEPLTVAQVTTPCVGEPVPETAPEVRQLTAVMPAGAEQTHCLRARTREALPDSGGTGSRPELRCHACTDRRDPESSQGERDRCQDDGCAGRGFA